jgi:zinc/manganese transport system substrate-binding protein
VRTPFSLFLHLFLLAAASPALAALNILACEPEWGALAKELGGDKVSIYVATTALQDPHHIEARPSLIARARSADLVVCTGAELEVGWVPLLQTQAGNPKIQSGQPGFFEATDAVALIEKPTRLDRSLGDVHAAGNPHVQLDPRNIAEIAAALGERMAQIDPREASRYAERTKDFLSRWRQATARWEKQAAPLKGMPVVVHHKNFSYFIAWAGMREVGTLEPRPGLPPSTASLGELLDKLKQAPPKAVLRAAFEDPRPSEWLASRVGAPAVVLPFTVGGSDKAKDLFGLYDDTLARLLAAVQ